ncbi:cadherin-23-like [Amphibalanus amphitrite]|uniref:cadherin-23-like n=1 Tax=Amphibalanus amphitrite TaxID=1232801 RepID=UPI001C915F83|nr:cadherin-23-like [Amphibalanus amphitrite]
MTIQVFAGDFCDVDGNCAHKVENLLRVTVLDDNDSPPQFPDQDGYLFDEPETTKSDTQLVGVAASDADQADSPASTLTYRLLDTVASKTGCPDSVQQLFTVETSGKEALVRAGRDLQDCWGVYNITLGATDGEEPFNNGTKQYQVRVKDINDAPTVTSPGDGFELVVPEDTYQKGDAVPVVMANGTAVVVCASDPDDPDTDNARLSYNLDGSTPDDATTLFYLALDPKSGCQSLMLRGQLDREGPNSQYDLHAAALDSGTPRLQSMVHIRVTVGDVDEFAPEFTERYNNATHFTEGNDTKADVKDITAKAQDDDQTDIIFYFLVGGDRDTFELVNSSAETPQLRNLKELDRETKDRYSLILKTIRENKQPPDVEVFDPSDPSQLSLTVVVDDINDVTPSFGERRFMGGIAAGDQQTTILRLQSDDADLDDPTTYAIVSEFTASDPSISNISQPFRLDSPDTAALQLNFDVSDGMDGYFDFDVSATDTAGHSDTTSVRIFIIVEADRVKFVFANQAALVENQQYKVADILTDVFSVDGQDYVANVETVTECPDGPQPCTNMITHFIDMALPEPVLASVIINLQFQGDVTKNLLQSLGQLNLNLTAIGDTTVQPPDDNDTVFQMLLIVVGSVLGGILALTCITSCIHTRKLRRQVKALSINAFGSRDSGMQAAGLAVPGTNVYQGANPIYDTEERAADAGSVSSGDSVLIGVEDAPEFASSGQRRGQPVSHANPAYQPEPEQAAEPADRLDVDPGVFDENSRHMPTFEPDDDDEPTAGQSPFAGSGESPFGGGATQNPLFGAEMSADGDLSDGGTHF